MRYAYVRILYIEIIRKIPDLEFRNSYVSRYSIDSSVGQALVSSAYSACRALIESDFESNFRMARGAPDSKAVRGKSMAFRLGPASACFGGQNLCASSRSALDLILRS